MTLKICFVFPYKGIGGVPVVFSQIAKYISENYDYEIYLVDYIDGAISKIINKKLFNFIQYHDSKKVYLPENSYIVFQGMTPWSIFPNLVIPKNAKLFFWSLYFCNFLPSIPGLRRYMQSNLLIFNFFTQTILLSEFHKARKFVNLLLENNGVAFYDNDSFLITKKFLNFE